MPDLLKPHRGRAAARRLAHLALRRRKGRPHPVDPHRRPGRAAAIRPRRSRRRGSTRRAAAWRPGDTSAATLRRLPMRPNGDRRLPLPARRRHRSLLRQVPHVERRAAQAPRLSVRARGNPLAHADDGRRLPRRGRRRRAAVRRALRRHGSRSTAHGSSRAPTATTASTARSGCKPFFGAMRPAAVTATRRAPLRRRTRRPTVGSRSRRSTTRWPCCASSSAISRRTAT